MLPPPPAPSRAEEVFGPRLGTAERYVALLATTGIAHGLLGPREGPRLWERHVLNCAVLADLIPAAGPGRRLIDVGSGAGLPGLVLAITRPDLEVHLVEPLARRTTWLTCAVAELALSNVTVHTARAESLWGELTAPWVTARAVTGIVRLAEWTLPLLDVPGQLLALKGGHGRTELARAEGELRRLGVGRAEAIAITDPAGVGETTVLRLVLDRSVDVRSLRAGGRTSAGSARRRQDRHRGRRDGNVTGRGARVRRGG
ncbi:16S rRNA (guanine(527)-N(7))-methyltransferase RsmG [Intrasporangium sp.]|uniref:16S rRNA (guanine(527)-N(7))-methyltransferase RsmG n=1 Tax=Intrasporangium sp. TaxID=1925024 RepID=UPI003221E3F4